jgi:hypothetical protein
MIWSLAMALLTLPSALVFSGAGDPFMSKSSLHWLAPLSIWLGAWFFAKGNGLRMSGVEGRPEVIGDAQNGALDPERTIRLSDLSQ